MVVFYPEFEELSKNPNAPCNYKDRLDFLVENLIILDCSNSMKLKGSFSQAQEIADLLLLQLNPSTYFNIITFGSGLSAVNYIEIESISVLITIREIISCE